MRKFSIPIAGAVATNVLYGVGTYCASEVDDMQEATEKSHETVKETMAKFGKEGLEVSIAHCVLVHLIIRPMEPL